MLRGLPKHALSINSQTRRCCVICQSMHSPSTRRPRDAAWSAKACTLHQLQTRRCCVVCQSMHSPSTPDQEMLRGLPKHALSINSRPGDVAWSAKACTLHQLQTRRCCVVCQRMHSPSTPDQGVLRGLPSATVTIL